MEERASLVNSTQPGAAPAALQTRRRYQKLLCIKVLQRCVLLALFALAYHELPVKQWIDRYIAWAQSAGNYAIPLFLAGATAFNAISPTGYLPTLLAGATFPWQIAWPLAYAQVNLGAMLNLLLVRRCCRPLAQRVTNRKFGQFDWLDQVLSEPGWVPAKCVMLVRLPYLWGGLFNYIFALSRVDAASYFLGNAVGFVPGSFLFVSIGSQARSMWQLLQQAKGPKFEQDAIELCVYAVLCVAVVVVMGVRGRKYFEEQERTSLATADFKEETRTRRKKVTYGEILHTAGEL